MKPILVLDADTDQALAVTRAMSEKGIPVHVAGTGRWGPAFLSARANQRFIYPSPVHSAQTFVSWLKRLLQKESYEAVFPLTDSTTTVLQKFRNQFPDIPFAMAGQESYEKVSDKFFSQDLARSHGLAVPKTFHPQSPQELDRFEGELNFPVVLKPRYSRFYDNEKHQLIPGDIRIIRNWEELKSNLSKLRQGNSFPCIQEWVPGTGLGVELLIKNGEVLASFCHQRIREMNPLGSGSSVCVSIPPRKDLIEVSAAMLKECHYEGAAMIEFRVDEKNQKTWFIEINGRFWGSLALPLACGINFPYLYLQALIRNEKVIPQQVFPSGVYARSLWKESNRLLTILKGRPSNWDGPFPSTRQAFQDYFRSFFQRNQIYCDVEMKDPLPGIVRTFSIFIGTLFRLISRPFHSMKTEGKTA